MPKPVSAPCWKRAPPKTDAVRVNQAATLAPSRGLAQNLMLFQLPGLSTLRSCQTATSVQSGFVFCRIRLLVPARRKKSPLATPSACCPQGGCFSSWGGPTTERAPSLRLRLAAPKGELFVLGRPDDGKGPLATPSACCPPRGSFLFWGGPTTKKGPMHGPLS